VAGLWRGGRGDRLAPWQSGARAPPSLGHPLFGKPRRQDCRKFPRFSYYFPIGGPILGFFSYFFPIIGEK